MAVDYCMTASPYSGFEVAHLLMQRFEYSVSVPKNGDGVRASEDCHVRA